MIRISCNVSPSFANNYISAAATATTNHHFAIIDVKDFEDKSSTKKNTTHHQNWYSLFAHLMWDAGLHLQIIIDTAPWLIHILSPCLSDESTGSAWPDWMQCTTLVGRPNPSIGYLDLYAVGSSFIFVFNYFCSAFFLTFKRVCWIQIMEFDGPGARIHTICINFK